MRRSAASARRGRARSLLAAAAAVAAAAIIAVAMALPQGNGADAGVFPASIAVDCNTSTAGVQSSCAYPGGTPLLDLAVVFTNESASPVQLGQFNFDVVGNAQVVFDPLPDNDAAPRDSNPDLNAEVSGSFVCSPPNPERDSDPDPGVSRSFLNCSNGSADGPTVAPGTSIRLATVHYSVSGTGAGAFSLENALVSDAGFAELMSCNPVISVPGDCPGASVGVGVGTVTPTLTATVTPTNTNTPVLTPTNTAIVTPTAILVTSADDVSDGACNAAHCSLREAITAANAAPGADRIEFAIGGGGIFAAIGPTSPLPAITGPVFIDGLTQFPTGSPAPVTIFGTGAGATTDGLTIAGGSSTVQGLVIQQFGGNGLVISGPAGGNVVNSTGLGDYRSNGIPEGNGGNGIYIDNSPNNDIGGDFGSLMSGNGRHGVLISGAAATGNVVRDSAIGLNYPTFDQDVGNTGSGVYIANAPDNVVQGNTIAGNDLSGIKVEGAGASSNDVVGNRIGVNVSGTAAIPNLDGVVVTDSASGTTIGGALPGDRNVISGNLDSGVFMDGEAQGNTVRGNSIGVNTPGTSPLQNEFGITLEGAADFNSILENVIAGNDYGIVLDGSGVDNNTISKNDIGALANGTPMGNEFVGILISPGASDNVIGGPTALDGNVIAHSGVENVVVNGFAQPTTGNQIRRNSIHSALFLGISLGNGGNNELAAPVISSVNGNTVQGTACFSCNIDVFSDTANEGRVYEGSTTAGLTGLWSFSSSLDGPNITATATDAGGNTSEFSAPFTPAGPVINGLALTVTEASIAAAPASIRIADIPIDQIPPAGELPSAPLSSIDMQASPLSSIPLSSIPLSSIPLSSIPLSSIPLSSIAISREGGWEGILEDTALEGTPAQNVTLQQLLELSPPPAALAPGSLEPLQLGELDLGSTALRSLGLASVAMGTLPLSSIDLLPGGGDAFAEWCAAIQAAGSSCATLGITQGNLGATSIASLDLRGVPLSSIPLSSIPLSSIPLSSIPLSSIPLSSIPLSSIPLSSIPLSSIPLSSIALGTSPLSSIPLSSIPLDTGDTFCEAFQPSPQRCQSLGLGDGSTLQQTVIALQSASIDPLSTPLSSISVERLPLSSIPLSSIRLGTSPLSSIPLSSIPLSSIGTPTYFCDAFPNWPANPRECGSLGLSNGSTLQQTLVALESAGIDPASTPLSSIPLSSIPLSSIPLSSIPLSSIPLSSIFIDGSLVASPLSSIPLSSIPLSSIAPNSVPLSSIPLSSIPLSSIGLSASPLSSIFLRDIPLSSIASAVNCSAPIDCSALSSDTLGDAADAGKLQLGANVGHLIGAFGERTLGDLRAYDNVTLADVVAAIAGATGADLSYSLNIFYGALTVVQANEQTPGVDLGNLTLGDLLTALLDRADYPWEDLPVADMQLANVAGGPTLHYNVSLNVTGTGAASNAVFAVQLPPGFQYVPGTSSFTSSNDSLGLSLSVLIPDPVVNGSQLTFRFLGAGAPLVFGGGDDVDLSFEVRPGLTLGSFTSSVTVTTDVVSASALNQDPVEVTENHEPNNDAGSATAIEDDALYISHIATPGDLDFYSLPVPAQAGSRISVALSHQSIDGDLTVARPTVQELRPSGTQPLGAQPVDDAPADVIDTQIPPPETLSDIPLSSIPLSSISANRGDADESVESISLTTNSTDQYTLQVSGYNGAAGPDPYVLRVKVTPPPPVPACQPRTFASAGQGSVGTLPASLDPGVNTLFLVNKKRLGDTYGASQADAVITALANAQLHSGGVQSAALTVDGDAGVATAYSEWDASPCSPEAANKVVAAINAVVDGYRSSLPDLQYIVLVGSDEIVPMARIPDITRVSNEREYAAEMRAVAGNNALFSSFVTSNILSDDAYGDFDPTPYLNRQLFVPDVALGRLVESPAQIIAQIGQFDTADGALDPQTALSTGYDFLSDSAEDVADALDIAIAGTTDKALIDPPNDPNLWTRTDLVNHFSGLTSPPDIASINAHFNHFESLPSAGNSIPASRGDLYTTADLTPANLAGTVIFSMGCHSALNVGDTIGGAATRLLDWPDASARQGAAVYVGNTGFGYGDTVLNAYSEELMTLFAQRLDGSLTIGRALQFAKQTYRGQDRVQFETYDEKVMVQTVFYGLPMYTVGTPPPPPPPPPPPLPLAMDAATGLTSAEFTKAPALELVTVPGAGEYYTADGKAASTSGRPIEPVTGVDLPVATGGKVAHGVVLTGLTSVDELNFDAVFTKPVIDASAGEVPVDTVFPAAISNLTTFDTPDGTKQRAVLMPGQYIPDSPQAGTPVGVGAHRRFTSITGHALYSDSEDFAPPAILQVEAEVVDGGASFTVTLADAAAAVSVLYHENGAAVWKNANLTQGPANMWTGTVTAGATIEYSVFAADAAGNVAQSTNKGEFYNGEPPDGCGASSDCDSDGFQDVAPTLHAGPANTNLAFDNCISVYNANQLNSDGNFTDLTPPLASDDRTWINSDPFGDACDPDDDNDGLTDVTEAQRTPCASATGATDSTRRDTDGDLVLDGAECALGSNPVSAASKPPNIVLPDADGDKLPDSLDPNDANVDSDGDGIRDGVEFRFYNSNVLAANTDGDICGDARELASVNGDNVVNSQDLGLVAKQFGASPPNHPNMDLDKNGFVNAQDLVFVAHRFGSCPP